MKSLFSGLSAKLALAVLAVGTMFTSCYDSENGDVTIPRPEPAKYYIDGHLTTDGGQELPADVSVTISGYTNSISVTNGSFSVEVGAAGTYTVSVVADGYKDATRTIVLHESTVGGVVVGNADFILYGVGENDLLTPDNPANPVVDATKEQAEEVLALVSDDIKAFATNLGLENVTITVDENGNTLMSGVGNPTDAPVNAPYTVQIPKFNGFASTIDQNADNLWTKAITQGQIWNASAARDLNMPYGLTQTSINYTFKAIPGQSLGTYTVNIFFENKALSYNGVEGITMYQSSYEVIYSYISHDGHDAHNNHGDSNGSGGGASSDLN